MSFFAKYPATTVDASNPSVGPNGDPIPSQATLVAGENPSGDLQPLQTNAAGALITSPDPAGVQHVIVDSSALPAGAATEATLATRASEATLATRVSEATIAARLTGSLTPVAYDQLTITYVGATTDIDTIVYRLAGNVVRTVTLSYDGSDRLDDVVAT